METSLPVGEFTCPITFERVRPPHPIVKEEGGISYVVQGDYELAFQTVLRFADASELPIKGKLFGENSQKVVVRDAAGKPAALSYTYRGEAKSLMPRAT